MAILVAVALMAAVFESRGLETLVGERFLVIAVARALLAVHILA